MTYMRSQGTPQWQPSPAPLPEPPPFHWLPHLLSFLRRRWPAMASSVGLCVALALAYVLTATPRFTAQAELLIDISRADLLRQDNAARDALTLNAMMESQVQLLQSAGLARKVVRRLGLDGKRHFVTAPPDPLGQLRAFVTRLRQPASPAAAPADPVDLAAHRLLRMLNIHRLGQTYVIGISVTSPDPREAAWLANGVAATYLADELQAKEDGIHQATAWLHVRIQELHDQALSADRAVQSYKAEHNIVDTDHGLMGSQQLTELSSQLVSARANTAAAQAKLQRIEAIMRNGIDGGNVADGLDNKVIVALRQQYVDDDRRSAELSAKFGSEHSAVRNLHREMLELKKSMQGELARIAQTYRSDYEVARSNEESVQARLAQMVAASERTNNDLVLLRSLQSSADTYRSLYQNFLQRYTQAVQDQSFPVPEARVITTAMPPQRKSAPKGGLILGFAVALGGALGFTLAFVRESTDTTIRSAAQLRAATGATCLGLVPRLARRRVRHWLRRRAHDASGPAGTLLPPSDRMLRHAVDLPRSPFATAIRALHMRIAHQHLRSRNVQVIGCVASAPGAGGSTIAANLACLLARTSGRTILLDWDFLAASLSHKLAGTFASGCLDVLAGRADLADAICRDGSTGMHFLPAGQAELDSLPIGQGLTTALHGLIAGLRSEYAYVVVDLPSLPAVADVHYAAHLLDAIVVVMQWGRADRVPLVESLAQIGLDEASLLGVVLNKADLNEKWRDVTPPTPEYAPSHISLVSS